MDSFKMKQQTKFFQYIAVFENLLNRMIISRHVLVFFTELTFCAIFCFAAEKLRITLLCICMLFTTLFQLFFCGCLPAVV